MAERGRARRADRLRATWEREIGPRLRRADDPIPAALAIDELLQAGAALSELGVENRDQLEDLVDRAAPATPFRATAHLALEAFALARRLGHRPTLDEIHATRTGGPDR